jgi:hypothetical protein
MLGRTGMFGRPSIQAVFAERELNVSSVGGQRLQALRTDQEMVTNVQCYCGAQLAMAMFGG